MHRAAAQAQTVIAAGATPLEGDLIEVDIGRLAEWMRGHDAVVFSAGAHGTGREKTIAIDGEGLAKAAAAAEQAKISRFVLVSGFPEAGRGGPVHEDFEHYLRVKKTADVHLVSTGLDWLIVRPGRLRDERGDGHVTAGPAVEFRDARRDNVAAFIAGALHQPALSRQIVELTDGPTPVSEAVARLIRQGHGR